MSTEGNIKQAITESLRKAQTPIGFVEGKLNRTVNGGTNTAGFIESVKADKNRIANKAKTAKRKVIDLGNRFQSAFGFVSSNQGESLQQTGLTDSLSGAAVVVQDGRSSFEEFTLRRPGLEFKFAYTGFVNAANVFAPPALLSFKSSKRIGSTIVSSNDAEGQEVAYGEVVENYGRKPVAITIRGLLIDMDNHEYPGDKVKQLTALFDWNGVWEVEGQIWRDKGIKSLYIESMEDGGVQGFMDTWQFTLEAFSIKPVEFFIKKRS
jgi:Domain of unknown function (DUF6046)